MFLPQAKFSKSDEEFESLFFISPFFCLYRRSSDKHVQSIRNGNYRDWKKPKISSRTTGLIIFSISPFHSPSSPSQIFERDFVVLLCLECMKEIWISFPIRSVASINSPKTEEEIKLIGFWLDSSAASEGLPNWLVAITWHIRKFQTWSLKFSFEITGRIHKKFQRVPKLTHFLRFRLDCCGFSMSWLTKTTNPFSLSMKFARKGGCRHAIIVVCAWLHVIVLWKETFCFRNLKQFLSCLI